MTDRRLLELDEDPDEALKVILGQAKGWKPYAAICLTQAIQHGDLPAGWGEAMLVRCPACGGNTPAVLTCTRCGQSGTINVPDPPKKPKK